MLNGRCGALLLSLALFASCGRDPDPPQAKIEKPKTKSSSQAAPPVPGETGGPPDDASPANERPAIAGGAQAAATIVETYYGLIEAGKYREAWKLRSSERGGDEKAFVESFGRYASYHATVGQPSQIAGAGGWMYVEVPVQIYGQLKNGEAFSSAGSVTLRRRDEGAAAERQWRIYS